MSSRIFGGMLLLLGCTTFQSVSSHTVEICAEVDGNMVTMYAGTYHGSSELGNYGGYVGGVTLSDGPAGNGRYDFVGTVVDDDEKPSGVDLTNFVCSRCSNYGSTTGVQNWQHVTVSGLASGTYGVTSTCDTAVECPWPSCAFDDITITVGPTTSPTPKPSDSPTTDPTERPTISPTWVAPCANDPCQCDSAEAGFEDPNCIVCHVNGCNQCDGTNGEFWKLDYNYPCVSCEETFGAECIACQDFNGCGQCADGYVRTYDDAEDLYHCVVAPPTDSPVGVPTDSPVPAPPSSCTDNITQCTASNCYEENPNCATQETWGCPNCDADYFMKSHQFPCTACTYLTGCTACTDYNGCDQTGCSSGYSWYWDSECNIGMCH